MCFGCSKETSYLDGSFEYPPHMFWMRNKENNFPIRTFIWRPGFNVIDDVIHKLQYHERKKYFIHIKQNMLMSDIYKTYRTYDNTYMYIPIK